MSNVKVTLFNIRPYLNVSKIKIVESVPPFRYGKYTDKGGLTFLDYAGSNVLNFYGMNVVTGLKALSDSELQIDVAPSKLSEVSNVPLKLNDISSALVGNSVSVSSSGLTIAKLSCIESTLDNINPLCKKYRDYFIRGIDCYDNCVSIVIDKNDTEEKPSSVELIPLLVKTHMNPLGIEPKRVWDLQRLKDLKEAMQRYTEANLPVPLEWVGEYNDLLDEYTNKEEL